MSLSYFVIVDGDSARIPSRHSVRSIETPDIRMFHGA